ncbi:hypothetical protein [Amycolatopsis sp. 195334CR]|uniref:hypothetical protein n=1 Tax=Amycolatopsis sp. 195334CR TaxID=2814588 RepID=UPI001A8FE767|nr:hypothetical protein [Amycolatopsis sp. 195334CR]MBN6034145.1 hypothetical protein [Amycolatopsis sp. 195334CR]
MNNTDTDSAAATADPPLPPNAVRLLPSSAESASTTMPPGAWGLLMIAGRTRDASAALASHGDTAAAHAKPTDLLAGVWLNHEPAPEVHRGDVVLRLHPPAHGDRSHTELLLASHGEWRPAHQVTPIPGHWPRELAFGVSLYLRSQADRALHESRCRHHGHDRMSPDALRALITAGLIGIGEQVEFDGHTAMVVAGGTLLPDSTAAVGEGVFTVSALATRLTRTPVNGWHLWRRSSDHRLLADLRTELANAPRMQTAPPEPSGW